MHSQQLTADSDTRTGAARRACAPVLSCLGLLLLTTVTGCVMPCFTGACNSKEPLYVSPMARFGSVERKLPECEPGKSAKPLPYFTFGKYWPFLDEMKTTMAATSAARKVLYRQMWDTKRWINAHYREGFMQAYIDVANGGNGELPPVPPPRYWNAHFRSPKGQWRAERWFDGYRAGSAMALVEMQPLRRITASYDWSIEKPKPPFVSSPLGVGNVGPAPGCPPVVQTGGFGMPGPQGFAPPPIQAGVFSGGGPMAPGYGQAPAPWGQPAPGTPFSMPGPPHIPAPMGPPPTGPGPTGPPPAQQPLPATSGAPAQPPNAVRPEASGGAPPRTNGLVPGHAGANTDVTPAPGGGPQNQPPRAIPQRLVPGFSPYANRPPGVPNDPPVWRTQPPAAPNQ